MTSIEKKIKQFKSPIDKMFDKVGKKKRTPLNKFFSKMNKRMLKGLLNK